VDRQGGSRRPSDRRSSDEFAPPLMSFMHQRYRVTRFSG
jgi:hypothetical protein